MVIMQEQTLLSQVDILSESILDNGDVKLKFRCHLHDDKRNNNLRIYEKASLKAIYDQLNPKAINRKLAGEMGHPVPTGDQASLIRRMGTIDPNLVGVLFTKLIHTGNSIDAEAETLTNDKGRNLYSMIKDNVGIGFSYRGFGKVDSNNVTIPSSIKSITYDVVFNESNNGAVVLEVFNESENPYGIIDELNKHTKELETVLIESSGIVGIENCPLGQCNIDNMSQLRDLLIESISISNNHKNIKINLK